MDLIRNTLHQGGLVLYTIVLVSFIAWTMIVWEWLRLREQLRGGWKWIDRAIDDIAHDRPVEIGRVDPSQRNLVGQLLLSGLKRDSLERSSFEAQIMPLLRSQSLELESPLRVIAVLAATMPLLGLLGTVMGMTQSFQGLTIHNQPQIDALAGGISQALITTQAGLVATVPVILVHRFIAARVRRYTENATTMIKRIEAVVCHDE